MNMLPRPLLDHALGYARRDLRVFPLHAIHSGDCSCGRDDCSSAGKHPRTKNGVKDATTDVEQITRWWTSWPEANIGIATGNGLYVIDIDCAKGGTVESLRDLGIIGCMWTRAARTGSGGYHLYLRCSQPLGNTASKLAPFVDTRGEGGYVVAPPSRNKHGKYSWYNSCEMQEVPEQLLARLRGAASHPFISTANPAPAKEQPFTQAQKEEERHAQTQATSAQTPVDKKQALAAALSSARLASEARNNYLVGMAGRLRGHGLSAADIRALLLTLNAQRYGEGRHPQGPLSLEELERTIFKSVAKWEQEEGVLPCNLPVVEDLAALLARTIPEPHWLIPHLLCEGLVLLAGKPKLGKSWLALALALDCALRASHLDNLALGRYPVNAAGVLYLSLEDSSARFQGRVNKLLNGRAVPENFAYALSWKPLLAGGLNDLDAALGNAPETRLVVIDTLARVRSQSMGNGSVYQEDYALMTALHELAARHHITLMLIHHTRKMESSDTFDEISGSTGLTGAADASIVLKRARGQSEATLYLTGRDIEEQELALTFNAADCTWTATGSAEERQVSQSRQSVLDLLEQNEAMTPAEIAKNLEKPRGAIKMLLHRMMQDGTLSKSEKGQYTLSDAAAFQQEWDVEES